MQVLQFEHEAARKKFLNKLEAFLSGRKKTLETIQTYREAMLANAETKEKRQKRLEHFFREAYALVSNLFSSYEFDFFCSKKCINTALKINHGLINLSFI